MIRLVIIDDHAPTRQKAADELSVDDVIEVVGQAETSDEGWKVAKDLLPDIVLLDLQMPGLMSIIDLVKRMVALANVKVVAFANEAKAAEVKDLFDAGVCAYVVKTDPMPLIRMTILMVSRGADQIISPDIPRQILHLNAQERTLLGQITPRGRLPKIAARIGVTEEELDKSLTILAEKLEIGTPVQLIRWARKNGF